MVAALGEGGEDAGADACVTGGLAADLLEHRGRHVVGAGEGGQPAAALEQAEAADIDLLVTARGGLDGVLAAREGRGIQHDEPEALAPRVQLPQAVEGIAALQLGARLDAVEGQVAPGQGQRVRGGVQQQRALGAGQQRVAGEGAPVAEGVQHPAPLGEAGSQQPIVALVEVEAGLLAGAQGHREAGLAFLDDQIAVGPLGLGRRLPDRVEAFDARRRRVVEAHDPAVGEERRERLPDPVRVARHAECEALEHAHRPVAVHHQAGQAVGLAPAEAIGGSHEGGGAPVLERRLQASPDQRRVDGLVGPREQAADQRGAWAVEAAPEVAAGGVGDF